MNSPESDDRGREGSKISIVKPIVGVLGLATFFICGIRYKIERDAVNRAAVEEWLFQNELEYEGSIQMSEAIRPDTSVSEHPVLYREPKPGDAYTQPRNEQLETQP